MATIKQVYDATANTAGSWSTLLDGLTSGSVSTSGAEDNSTNKFLAMDLEIKVVAGAGHTSGTFDVYLVRSADNSDFSSDPLFLTSVILAASTTSTKVIRVEQLPKYFKFYVDNNSNDALGTGSALVYYGVDLSNA